MLYNAHMLLRVNSRTIIFFIAITLFLSVFQAVYAEDDAVVQTVDEAAIAAEIQAKAQEKEYQALQLKSQIDAHAENIKKLEAEISKYQKDLNSVSSKKRTLSNTIYELDVSRKKATANISLTKSKILTAEDRIETLAKGIDDKNAALKRMQAATRETVRNMNEAESTSFMELFLRNGTISDSWNEIKQLGDLEGTVQIHSDSLKKEKATISNLKNAHETQKKVLAVEQKKFVANKQYLDATRNEKGELLKITKNQESEYQRILKAKQKAKEEFEAQMRDYESKLKYVLDTSRIPIAGKGVLHWPLDSVKITQKFGNTAFAKAGAYSGKGHNGIDFRASTGTPIKAALTGVIVGTGNTDAQKGCYSYGKWVLIRHPNGLSTLYGHLSSINVTPGSSVETGDIIGYSGNTGYSTGPHLHFTVYAADAVKVVRLGTVKAGGGCSNVSLPVSAWAGYLDPLEYL